MTTSASTENKDKDKVLVTNRDYDRVLGMTLCLLTQRMIGRAHLKEKNSSYYKFTFKTALLEQLDSNHVTLIEKRTPISVLEKKGKRKFTDKSHDIEDAFFYFDAALRLLISPDSFVSKQKKSSTSTTKTTESEYEEEREEPTTFLTRKRKLDKLRKAWELRRSSLGKGIQVWELFKKASLKAWDVFSSIFNECTTLQAISASYSDIEDGGSVFLDLLLVTKILLPCALFRNLEEKELNISRDYQDSPPFNKSVSSLLEQLKNSPFISESIRGIMMKKLHSPRKGKEKYRLIRDVDTKYSFPVKLTFILNRIAFSYFPEDSISFKYMRRFDIINYPSLFQRKVEVKTTISNKILQPDHVRKTAKVPLGLKDRLALITEDSDTSLLTVGNSSFISLFDTNSTNAFVNIEVKQDQENITTFASNREWIIFGSTSGNLFLYRIDEKTITFKGQREKGERRRRGKREKITKITEETLILSQEDSISCMILNSKNNRLFTGSISGTLVEWDLDLYKTQTLGSHKNQQVSLDKKGLKLKTNLTLHRVTSLCSDERTTITARYCSKFLFSGHGDGTICVWNVINNEGGSFLLSSFKAHDGIVTSLAFRDTELFSGGGVDQCFKVWIPPHSTEEESKLQARIVMSDKISAITVDYQVVIVACKFSLCFYERNTFSLAETLKLEDNKTKDSDSVYISSMTIDRKRRLYTVDKDIRIWDLESLLQTMDLSPRLQVLNVTGTKVKARGRQAVISKLGGRTRKSKARRRGKSQHPSDVPEVEKSLSTDMNLLVIINNPVLRRAFNQFLRERSGEENLHFWLLVEQYEYFAETTDSSSLAIYGREIIEEHIYSISPHPINIQGDLRLSFRNLKDNDFTATTFEVPKARVFELLENNFKYEFIEKYNKAVKAQDEFKGKKFGSLLGFML